MHFTQEFKFNLGDRVIYKDPKSGETEEVTIRRRLLRIDKDGQKVTYKCMECCHKLVGYWSDMSEENLSFAGEEHGTNLVAGDVLDGLGGHLEIGDNVFVSVYYSSNGINVKDRVPNVDFTFADEFKIESFTIVWDTEFVVNGLDYQTLVHGKLMYESRTVGGCRYGMPIGYPMREYSTNVHKMISENFAEEYVTALHRKGNALIGKKSAQKAWDERNENSHTFYVIKRWLTHLGKFDEVAKLIDEWKLEPKNPKPKNPKPKNAVDTGDYAGLDDIIAKMKSNPSFLAKVKELL